MTLSPKSTQSRAGKTLRCNPLLGHPPPKPFIDQTLPHPPNPDVVCCYREIRVTVKTKHADVVPGDRRVLPFAGPEDSCSRTIFDEKPGRRRPVGREKRKKKPNAFLYCPQETCPLGLSVFNVPAVSFAFGWQTNRSCREPATFNRRQ